MEKLTSKEVLELEKEHEEQQEIEVEELVMQKVGPKEEEPDLEVSSRNFNWNGKNHDTSNLGYGLSQDC